MNISQLKELLADFSDDIKFEYDLKKKIGLILEEKQRYDYNANNLKELVNFLKK